MWRIKCIIDSARSSIFILFFLRSISYRSHDKSIRKKRKRVVNEIKKPSEEGKSGE